MPAGRGGLLPGRKRTNWQNTDEYVRQVVSDSREAIVFTRRSLSWVSTMPAAANLELTNALKSCMTGAGAEGGAREGVLYLGWRERLRMEVRDAAHAL
jgi:hypothetical protein